jgi:hypothetical protein
LDPRVRNNRLDKIAKMIRSFMICTLYLKGDQIKENEMGHVECLGEIRNSYKAIFGKCEETM